MDKKDRNYNFHVTGFEAVLFLAFLLVPWLVGMFDICNLFWNTVLK